MGIGLVPRRASPSRDTSRAPAEKLSSIHDLDLKNQRAAPPAAATATKAIIPAIATPPLRGCRCAGGDVFGEAVVETCADGLEDELALPSGDPEPVAVGDEVVEPEGGEEVVGGFVVLGGLVVVVGGVVVVVGVVVGGVAVVDAAGWMMIFPFMLSDDDPWYLQ